MCKYKFQNEQCDFVDNHSLATYYKMHLVPINTMWSEIEQNIVLGFLYVKSPVICAVIVMLRSLLRLRSLRGSC